MGRERKEGEKGRTQRERKGGRERVRKEGRQAGRKKEFMMVSK